MNDRIYPPIRGIVFDMDGLIFDSERVVQRSWESAGNELGIPHMGAHIYHTVGFNRQRRTQYFREHIGADFPDDIFAEKARVKFREIVDREGLAMKPGVRELFEYAKDRGIRLAVATSSRKAYACGLLQTHNLMQFLDGYVTGDMVSQGKPDPEIYRTACHVIGVEAKEALALEDAPSGIRAAVSAGMRAIVIPDLVAPGPDIEKMAWYKFETLFDVLALLKRGNE